MKRLALVFLILSIILGGLMPIISHAQTELNKELETIILRVKKLFNISNDYDNFTQRLDSNNEEKNFYLNWSDSKNILANINITTDSKGFIISYNKYYVEDEPFDKTSSLTKEEAELIAFEFIRKIAPEIVNNIELKVNRSPLSLHEDAYNFEYYRTENTIPYYDNNIIVSINKFTGQVNSYYANWDKNIQFPNPNKAISLENAKQEFQNQIGLHLIYKTAYGMYWRPGPREADYFLAYSLINNNKAIDAFTGKATDINYYGVFTNVKTENSLAADRELTPYEIEEIDKLKDIKDIIEIEKKAREILELAQEYKLINKNLFSSWNNKDEFNWALTFRKTVDENNKLDANINLNAKTGELISYYIYENHNPLAKPNINKEQALQIAKEFLKNNIGEKYKELEYRPDESQEADLNYNFNFIRKVDNIYIEGDNISIGVDGVSKKVVSYWMNWLADKIPSTENTISLDKAYEILYNNIAYELRYVKVYNREIGDDNKEEIKLVYLFKNDNPIIIDCFTGKLLDNNGKEYTANKIVEYIDIDNSYAKDKIKTLSQYGISFDGDQFRPKDKINHSEFLYLLWKSLYNSPIDYNDANEEMLKQLKAMGIVRSGDLDGDSLLSKEESVKYIIRAMNYDKIADQSHIFKDLWKDSSDITKGLNGYLNIAYGLNIIQGDGKTNNISPKYLLNREDGANIIYNYLFMK